MFVSKNFAGRQKNLNRPHAATVQPVWHDCFTNSPAFHDNRSSTFVPEGVDYCTIHKLRHNILCTSVRFRPEISGPWLIRNSLIKALSKSNSSSLLRAQTGWLLRVLLHWGTPNYRLQGEVDSAGERRQVCSVCISYLQVACCRQFFCLRLVGMSLELLPSR